MRTNWAQQPPCFSYVDDVVLTLICTNLHKKSSEVLYQNKVNSSLIFIQKSGNFAHNCKMVKFVSRVLSLPHSRKYSGCGSSGVC